MSRTAAHFAVIAVIALSAACDKVALLAPTGSTVTLSVSSTSVGSNGTAEIVATVIEAAGTPVHNGTEVTFQSSVGIVEPATARTEGGLARATFRANGASGTARVLAFSGGAKSTEVEVRVGSAAAERVAVSLSPNSVPASGAPVQVTASVTDVSGNPLSGAQVSFSADNGVLSSNSAVTNAQGEATVSLTTSRQTVVRASVAGKEGQATVNVSQVPTASVSLTPPAPVAGQTFTLTVTPTVPTGASPVRDVIIDFGDGSPRRNLGAITAATPVAHSYSRANNYVITVTVIAATGESTTTTIPVVVQSAVVNVAITAPPTGDAGQAVTASVAVTNPNNIPLSGVRVNWGDGGVSQLGPTGGSAQHSYNTANTHTITASALDASGNAVSSSSHQIQIRPRAALTATLDAEVNENQSQFTCSGTYPKTCRAAFDAWVPPPGGQQGVRVVFRAAATGGLTAAPAFYDWDFGDGSPIERSTNANRDHLYPRRGVFTVRVRVTMTDGNQGEQTLTLELF